jgi:nicotinate-nucleotide adenylyltransferase
VRLGFFGGSFDPPHIGHYLAAVDAAERLALDRVFWIPAAQQPLKTDDPHGASALQRYAMVDAAASAYPSFEASRIEIDRVGLSYTITTVETFARQFPTAERFLLVGEDAWNRFSEWREPDRIRTLVQIHVLARATGSQHSGRVIDVSSTEIRARARAGQSIRGFVQDAVAELIESQGLYRW